MTKNKKKVFLVIFFATIFAALAYMVFTHLPRESEPLSEPHVITLTSIDGILFDDPHNTPAGQISILEINEPHPSHFIIAADLTAPPPAALLQRLAHSHWKSAFPLVEI